MTEKFVWVLCLGIVGMLAVAVVAPALPTAVSVVDDDQTVDPPDPDDEAAMLEETLGEEPTGAEGGSLPADWLLLGVGAIGLVILARIGFANPDRRVLVLALGIAVVGVLGWLGTTGWNADDSPIETVPGVFSLVVAALLLALGLGGAAVVLARTERVDPSLEPTVDPAGTQDEPQTDRSVPEAAVSSADVPADSDVYRTWRRLADSVGKRDDETATPADVSDAAIERGFDADAVDALTRLFEDSRYGNRAPTPDRERQARELERSLLDAEGDADG